MIGMYKFGFFVIPTILERVDQQNAVPLERQIMTRTVEIRYCEIPEYLRKGAFYRSLSNDDPQGTIEIPADCFAEDAKLTEDLEQFIQLLRVMIFWVLDSIPLGVIKFCSRNDITVWRDAIMSLPGENQSPLVRGLLATFHTMSSLDFEEALKTGDWKIIKRCVDGMNPLETKATILAAKTGHLQALNLLHQKEFTWDEETCMNASQNGHLDCLQFAHQNGCPWDSRVFTQAMSGGHLHCIQYAHQQGLEWSTEVCTSAADKGQLNCLQYLVENGCPWDVSVYTAAAKKGHLHIIQYAHQQGLEWNADVCTSAAWSGHTECLLFVLALGCPINCEASTFAAQNGHLNCLQLLHQYNAPWDENTCSYATMGPDIACLQYLHENNCPWDELTTISAVHHNNIDALRYVLEHGCPHSGMLIELATKNSNIQCLEYLIETHGVIWYETENVFVTALLKGNLQCLVYLLNHGCPCHNVRILGDDVSSTYYDTIFTKNNPEFIQCLEYVVMRGWCMDQSCIDYLVSRDWDN